MELNVNISPEVAAAAPDLQVLVVEAVVANPPTPDALWNEIQLAAGEIRAAMPME